MTGRPGARPAVRLLAAGLLALSLSACSLPFVGGGGGSYTLTAFFPRAVVFAMTTIL